jgi:hypothetical protein
MPYSPSTDSYERTYAANSAVSVTTSDTADLSSGFTRAVYVGGTGDLAVNMIDGTSVTFKAIPAGALLPISVTRIKSTGTTATNIVALK